MPAGILVVNLGTPEAPTPEATRAYLREFLSDPRVVDIPRAIWLPILYLFVLPRRPKLSAARYAQIWTRDGSPLRYHTEQQARYLQGYMGERFGTIVATDYAMRYGKPSIAEQLESLKARGCDRVLLLPLYPQYAGSTTAAVFDAADAAVARMPEPPEIRIVRDFHDDAGYISALAASVRDFWMKRGRPDVLVMSFHGIPERAVRRGDPYETQCRRTAALLAESLDLRVEDYLVTFQSRFGRARWLQPYTAEVLKALGQRKTGIVDVICPGFIVDCLETLEEIAIEGKTLFLEAGGGEYRYIPALNERLEWLDALTNLTARHLGEWLPPFGPPGPPGPPGPAAPGMPDAS